MCDFYPNAFEPTIFVQDNVRWMWKRIALEAILFA